MLGIGTPLSGVFDIVLVKNFYNDKLCFTEILLTAFLYLRMNRLITSDTYFCVERTCCSRDPKVLEQYADGSVLYQIWDCGETASRRLDSLNCDLFRPLEYVQWLFEVLYRDEIFHTLCPFRNYEEFLNYMQLFTVPDWFVTYSKELIPLADCCVLIDDMLYYTNGFLLDEHTLMSECGDLITSDWDPSEGQVLLEGVQETLMTDPSDSDLLYCVSYKEHAYLRYHISSGAWEKMSGRDLIGVTNTGAQVYLRKNHALCLQQGSGHRILTACGANPVFSVHRDYILAEPDMCSDTVFPPFKILFDGSRKKLNQKEAAAWLWKEFLDRSAVDFMTGVICKVSDALLFWKMYQGPKLMTIRNLKHSLEKAARSGILLRGRYRPAVSILNLLEEKGVSPEEDITDLMFTLFHYSRQNQEAFRRYGYLHNALYLALRGMAKRSDFMALLREDPETLFRESAGQARHR